MKKILIILISLILIISNAYADKCYDSDTTPIILDSDKKLGRFFEDQPDVNDDFQVHIVYTLLKDSKDKEGDINGDFSINIQDVILGVNIIIQSLEYNSQADMNSDGLINVLDRSFGKFVNLNSNLII